MISAKLYLSRGRILVVQPPVVGVNGIVRVALAGGMSARLHNSAPFQQSVDHDSTNRRCQAGKSDQIGKKSRCSQQSARDEQKQTFYQGHGRGLTTRHRIAKPHQDRKSLYSNQPGTYHRCQDHQKQGPSHAKITADPHKEIDLNQRDDQKNQEY